MRRPIVRAPGRPRVRFTFEEEEAFDAYPTVGTVNDLTVSEEEDGLVLPDGRRIPKTRRPIGFRPPESPP